MVKARNRANRQRIKRNAATRRNATGLAAGRGRADPG